MGKLDSPRSQPAAAVPTFPRMDPPPPYEAGSASSRSSSAHSHDQLRGGEGSRDAERRQTSRCGSTPQPRQNLDEERPETRSEMAKVRPYVREDGCCTFGDGASGCMVYGDRASGCMNIGDDADGCMNYHSRDGCCLVEATGGGCLNFYTKKSGCMQCG